MQSTTSNLVRYRPEIDGLRAIAVLSVLAFHLGVPGFGGGFTGVDVFFVISGYLITSQVWGDCQRRQFSIVTFYVRRTRRIVPALVVILLFVVLVGAALLLPGDLTSTADSALYAVFAASNFYMYFHTGYFDGPAALTPLLHTWSLAVEEQFYLLWPACFALAYRISRGRPLYIAIAIAIVTAMSFLFGVRQIAHDPKAAFYLPGGRAWELASGALIALVPDVRSARRWHPAVTVCSLAGLALIVEAIVATSSTAQFPGFNALLPIAGSALFLLPRARPSIVDRLFGTPPIAIVGRISYSLYLWHWPIIVYWRIYNNGADLTNVSSFGIALASIALAYLSYSFVERPFRTIRVPDRLTLGVGACALGVVALVATAIVQEAGFPQRLPRNALALSSREAMWTFPCRETVSLGIVAFEHPDDISRTCSYGAPWSSAAHHAVLWGDSNAEHFAQIIDRVATEANTAVALVTPCPPPISGDDVMYASKDVPDYSQRCGAQRASVIRYLKATPSVDLVIMSARWTNITPLLHTPGQPVAPGRQGADLLKASLSDTIDAVSHEGRRIVIFNDIPGIPMLDPRGCALSLVMPLRAPCRIDMTRLAFDFLQSDQKPIQAVIANVSQNHPSVTVYSPDSHLCRDGRCTVSIDGDFIYRDEIHLRRNLSDKTLTKLSGILELSEILDQGPTR